jgi:CBS domain-containing protein
MITVSRILKAKSGEIFHISPDNSVYDAIKLMSEKNVGALPVLKGNSLVGIFSERDYARKVVLLNRKSQNTLVGEIMTEKVITVDPNYTLEDCMEMMTVEKIRHLPVMQGNRLIGIISIGDVVNTIIESQKEIIDQLQLYISQ